MRPHPCLTALILSCLLISSTSPAADQPQWGQRFTRNMVSDETNLPDSFDPATGKNIKWVADLGNETHGSPIIANGKILIGTNNGNPRDTRHVGDRGVLMCFNEADGKFLWQLVVPKITGDKYLDWPNAGIVSPATIDGDRAYVMTNRAEIVCLNLSGLASGNTGPYQGEARHQTPKEQDPVPLGPTDADIIWLCDLEKEAGIYHHDGAHCSPLLVGDYLYCNTVNGVDNTHRRIRSPDAPSLVVLDKKTGRIVARDDQHIGPRIAHCQWSSPALAEISGQTQIIFGGADGVVYGFAALQGSGFRVQGSGNSGISLNPEPRTLNPIWSFDCDPTSPKETGPQHTWTGNRRESPSDILSMPVFYKGRIYVTVGGDVWWGKRQGWLKCIDPTKTGDVTTTAEIWSYPTKHIISTPAIANGLAFVIDFTGAIHCVDIKTGQPCWIHETKAESWGSCLIADGKVYVGTRRGQFLTFALDRQKRLLSSLQLDSGVSSTPVAANGVLYVATQAKLYAIRK